MSPENPTKKTSLLIAGIIIALFLIGGGIGVYLATSGQSETPDTIDLDQEILPDVNSVPKDKPLPPAPKEVVLKQMKYYEIGPKDLLIFDTEKDGNITRIEFRTYWENNFRQLDRNKDGKLVRKEWGHRAFKGVDLDKNGNVESQEWMRFRDWCFDTFLDSDKDGIAVPGEWKK